MLKVIKQKMKMEYKVDIIEDNFDKKLEENFASRIKEKLEHNFFRKNDGDIVGNYK